MSNQPIETIYVDEATAGCDGGGGALGHPLVYLNMGAEGRVDCPYCGRRFIQSEDGKTRAGHGH